MYARLGDLDQGELEALAVKQNTGRATLDEMLLLLTQGFKKYIQSGGRPTLTGPQSGWDDLRMLPQAALWRNWALSYILDKPENRLPEPITPHGFSGSVGLVTPFGIPIIDDAPAFAWEDRPYDSPISLDIERQIQWDNTPPGVRARIMAAISAPATNPEYTYVPRRADQSPVVVDLDGAVAREFSVQDKRLLDAISQPAPLPVMTDKWLNKEIESRVETDKWLAVDNDTREISPAVSGREVSAWIIPVGLLVAVAAFGGRYGR